MPTIRLQYSVRTWCPALLLALLALITFTPSADAAKTPPSFWGLADHGGSITADDARNARAAGAQSMVVLLYWPAIAQGTSVPFNWDPIDRQVAAVAAQGMRPVLRLWGNPHARNDRVSPMRSKTARKQWSRMVGAAARRYGSNGQFWRSVPYRRQPVTYWQVLNEPNAFNFYLPKPNPREYARLIKLTNVALRKVDRKAKVVLGGMFGTLRRHNRMTQPWDFLRGLYKVKRIARHFDSIALHPYAKNLKSVKKLIARSRKVVKRAGDRKAGLYITEIGWSSASRSDLDHTQAVGPEGQARMMRRAFTMFLKQRRAWRLRGIVWFSLQDAPASAIDPCTWCVAAGLLNANGTLKPAWSVFRGFATGARG